VENKIFDRHDNIIGKGKVKGWTEGLKQDGQDCQDEREAMTASSLFLHPLSPSLFNPSFREEPER
jgi:hypothetical protein